MENEKIVINKNGQDIECKVLFTFDSEDTGKAYIGYTDGSVGVCIRSSYRTRNIRRYYNGRRISNGKRSSRRNR